eukprot:Seg1904.3 transcript_id=Seg1904.3/GoldUCD/mRNA.D3Y31 product="Vacuolar protein sorting-associated protein 37A" protein_id=Seg1904.3/GoldUCD/D3Y31
MSWGSFFGRSTNSTVDAPSIPGPTPLQQQRLKQVESLRNFNQNVIEDEWDKEYHIKFTAGEKSFTLNIILPLQFPNEKPIVRISPGGVHPWLDEMFYMHSNLGKVVHQIIDEFKSNPPNTMPAPQNCNGAYGGGTSQSFSKTSPTTPTAILISTEPTEEEINPVSRKDPSECSNMEDLMLAVSNMSTEELNKLQDDSDQIIAYTMKMNTITDAQTKRIELLQSNKELAEQNLSCRPRIQEIRENIDHKSEIIISLESKLQAKVMHQEEVYQMFDLDNIITNLRIATSEAEVASEDIAERFLNKKLPVEEFLPTFLEQRKKKKVRKEVDLSHSKEPRINLPWELKNKVTGIDLMVPDYEEKAGRISKTATFNVIVITRLFYYKTPRHKESDVVQFLISKRFEEFEDLYQKLNARFPSVLFPALPAKSMIVNTSVLLARKKFADELMHLVARTQKLCCSPMILEFLGVRKPSKSTQQTIVVSEDIYEEKKTEEVESTPEQTLSPEIEQSAQNEARKLEEEHQDLFVPVDLDTSNVSDISGQDDIFNPSNSKKLQLHASLFEDELEKPDQKDETDLFMPADAKVEVQRKVALEEDEDTDDLLNVEESMDDLLALSKKSERKQSIKAATTTSRPSVKPKPQTRTSFEANPEDDDFSLLAAASKTSTSVEEKAEKDFFAEARTKTRGASLRDKRQQLSKEDTLDDIFGKGKDSRNIFGKHNDDDLFTTPAAATVDEASALEEDDIMKYINDNLDQDVANLDL